MADFNNRQLAEITAQIAETIKSSVLKEQKIANELKENNENLTQVVLYLKKQIEELKQTSIEPDLSKINSFYREKTEENVNRINSRLKVPNFSIYIWIASVLLFLSSGLFVFLV